jgi:hypothetical protein
MGSYLASTFLRMEEVDPSSLIREWRDAVMRSVPTSP